MGLDMYLNAKRYMSGYFDASDIQKQEAIQALFPELADLKSSFDGSPVKEISIEAGYWRKANAIHDWFVKNVQDGEDKCRPHRVSREKLEELKMVCERVLEGAAEAEEELPTRSGFFFGNTDYDDWYMDGLRHTVKVCERCLALPNVWDFEYCSSW
jgi:hypothetical protein